MAWRRPGEAIIWTNDGILLIGPLGTNFSEILVGIQTFSFNKMHLKMSSAKWRPFCLGLNVLTLTKDTPCLVLTGEPWGLFWEDLGEKWPRHNSTALYVFSLRTWYCRSELLIYLDLSFGMRDWSMKYVTKVIQILTSSLTCPHWSSVERISFLLLAESYILKGSYWNEGPTDWVSLSLEATAVLTVICQSTSRLCSQKVPLLPTAAWSVATRSWLSMDRA